MDVQGKKAEPLKDQENKEDNITKFERLAQQARGLLHPTNFLYGLLLRDLYSALSTEGHKERAFTYLQMSLLPTT